MAKKKDKFADVNGNKNRSNMVVFAIAVLAVCISGVLCARKLQLEQKYISLNEVTVAGCAAEGSMTFWH